MRVAVYIRQLTSLGGGNRYALGVAEHLSRTHQVDVLTHTPIAAARIARQLNLDLARVNLRFLAEQPAADLGPVTAEYDLFINTLHNFYVPCQAAHGVIILFFPPQYQLDARARIRRIVANGLRRFLAVELSSTGVFESEFADNAPVRLLSHRAELRIAASRGPVPVTFRLQNPAAQAKTVRLLVDDEVVSTVTVAGGQDLACALSLPAGGRTRRLGFRVDGGRPVAAVPVPAAVAEVEAHMRLANFQIDHPKIRLYGLLFERLLPQWRDRLLNVPPERFLELAATYDRIWAISEFSQHWTQVYWNRPSDLVYPMVEVETFQARPKLPQILSVGRFFLAGHNKKHLLMVQVFKQLVDQGLTGWTLHLAGGVVDDAVHRQYLESVRQAAANYPIQIHANAPFSELQRLYGESALYWHAAGYGEDGARAPIRLEHFGVTTVEAMAAGCVPVVIRKGGQTEIIDHGRTGFLWDRPQELGEHSLRLIQDPDLRRRMGRAAVEESRRFDRAHFGEQIDRSLADMGAPI